jgi:hypothetical protein
LFLALHGIGLLVMLVAGIGIVHKKGLAWDPWLLSKIAIWVLVGATPTLVKNGVLPRMVALVLALALGGAAAWLAHAKPF